MKTAIVVTGLGVSFVVVLNQIFFGYSFLELVWMVGCANLAIFSSLFLILRLEKLVPINKILLGSILKAWFLFVLIFSSQLVLSCPILKNFYAFGALLLPLIASGGIGVIAFGLIRDYWLRKRAAQSKSFVSNRI